jgi:hypothetical protein
MKMKKAIPKVKCFRDGFMISKGIKFYLPCGSDQNRVVDM